MFEYSKVQSSNFGALELSTFGALLSWALSSKVRKYGIHKAPSPNFGTLELSTFGAPMGLGLEFQSSKGRKSEVRTLGLWNFRHMEPYGAGPIVRKFESFKVQSPNFGTLGLSTF